MSKEGNGRNDISEGIINFLKPLATPEGIQTYILGTKRNGQPRSLYDVVRNASKDKRKKKKKKNPKDDYTIYLTSGRKKGKKKKGKKGKKKNKYWHIDY